uniref:Transmembrane 4 L six family member 21a n=1 Tax=Latimeria chalumnae TaxID=7897 RepID=H2ZSQ4_LATCH
MCTGKCSKCIGGSLYPFAFICLICNILLFFPGWSTTYIQSNNEDQITKEVLYVGGIIGGGLMVLVPAIHIQATGRIGCCANRCGMFLSIIFALIGVAGGLYAFVTSILGLVNGPTCCYSILKEPCVWMTPFKQEQNLNESYLFQKELWDHCVEPKNVVEFNVILFAIILAASGIEIILCAIQAINGFFGCLCGTCMNKGGEYES